MHLVDGRLEGGNRFGDVVVHDGQIEKVAVRLAQHVRLFGQTLEAAVVLFVFDSGLVIVDVRIGCGVENYLGGDVFRLKRLRMVVK